MSFAPYEEFAPPSDLAAHVACLWRYDGLDAAEDQRIAPDGCCELIVHHGEPYAERRPDGSIERQPRVLFAGQLTRPLHLRASARTGVIGVRFKPAGAWAFVGAALQPLTNRRVPLEQLHGAAATALTRSVDAATTPENRLAVVSDYIATAITSGRRDRVVEACIEVLAGSEGATSAELARRAGIGARQLQRRFAQVVGLSPRELAAVFRFRRIFDALSQADTANWSDAAQAAGYFDHPQLARDFRRFVGCTASEFIRAKAGLATNLTAI